MKIYGRQISGPNVEILVIPRPEGDIVFKAQAVLDYTIFDRMVPKPTPPLIRRRGSRTQQPDRDDKNYLLSIEQYGSSRVSFMVIESLKATPGLEWDLVKYENPDTWGLYEKELQESGFTRSEINMIVGAVMTANSLNEDKLEEARQRFLASEEELKLNGLSQKDGQPNTQSGEPANASV